MALMLVVAGLGFVQLREDRVQAAVTLLRLAPVALDPLAHQVEDLRLQPYRPRLGPRRPAHHPGVLEHFQVLVDRLERNLVWLGELVHSRVAGRQPGRHVAPGRIRECREDPGQLVHRHRHLTRLVFQPFG
jgi:hypothetical protein